MKRKLSLTLFLTLSACATARLYSVEELSAVERQCGLAVGEIVQEPEEPRLLFFYASQASEQQYACANAWARKRHLHLARIEAVEFSQ